jgi:Autotransporter beta-domain
MFKQFKSIKGLALASAVSLGNLYAPTVNPPAQPVVVAGGGISANAATQINAPISTATTSSSTVTGPTVMAVEVRKTMGLVSAVAAEAVSAMHGNATAPAGSDGGVKTAGAAGSTQRSSVWMRASYGGLDNTTSAQEWNGHSYLAMIGADYRFNSMFCAGLGASYNRMDLRTEFNKGTQKNDTFGINPYLIVAPHKNFYLEFVGGASWGTGKDTRRLSGTEINDNTWSDTTKATNLFAGAFANFINTVGKANFGLQVGYLTMQKKIGSFTETSSNAAYNSANNAQPANTYQAQTVTGKVKAGYQLTPSVAPFLTLHAEYDVKENQGVSYPGSPSYKVGRSGFGGGGGVNLKSDDSLSGSMDFDYSKRGNLNTYVTAVRVHYGF